MNVTASQIRQDLNNFGGFGQQGYGYNIKSLYGEIGKLLGLDKEHNVIIIGAGNIGQAIANYHAFDRSGFRLKGMFDIDPALEGMEVRGGIKVRLMDELDDFIKENDIEIAALTIPKTEALKVAEKVAGYGIKGIWNFTHKDLKLPEDITVESVHLSDSLMKLFYRINQREEAEA